MLSDASLMSSDASRYPKMVSVTPQCPVMPSDAPRYLKMLSDAPDALSDGINKTDM